MMKAITNFLLYVFLLSPINSYAEVRFVYPKQAENLDIKVINIFFEGKVTSGSIGDLRYSIERVGKDFPDADIINLLLNSRGGDMDSGWIGYWAIRNSTIPVRAINISSVESSATLLYCAAKQRATLRNTNFLLHPAAMRDIGDVKPDELARVQQRLYRYNDMFSEIYQSCTNLSNDQIDRLLSSEHFSLWLSPSKAQNVQLVSEVLQRLPISDVSVFVRR